MMMMFTDSAEHTAANYATNTASEESCHQYIDNDGIAVIDLGQILSIKC